MFTYGEVYDDVWSVCEFSCGDCDRFVSYNILWCRWQADTKNVFVCWIMWVCRSVWLHVKRSGVCCFLLLIKFMIITRHEVPLVYCKWTNCFHIIFRVSNSKHSIHAILAIQFVFPLFLTSTQMTADTIGSYVPKKSFTDDKLTA